MDQVLFQRVYMKYFDVQKSDIVIDVGAHIGTFSLYAWARGAEKVYAYEPSRDNYEYFVKNIKLNHAENIQAYNVAVHPIKSEAIFYEEKGREKSMSNLFKIRTPNSISYQVKCMSLDYILRSEIVDQVDFLKMNIEGTEHELLQKTELMRIKKIAMEVHDIPGRPKESLEPLLRRAGYNTAYDSPDMTYLFAWRSGSLY